MRNLLKMAYDNQIQVRGFSNTEFETRCANVQDLMDKNNIDALRLFGLLAFKNKNYVIAEKLFIFMWRK